MQRRAHPARDVPWLTPDTHPAAWTDLAALPLGGRVTDGGDHAVVICDERQAFWFGNCLVLRGPPRADAGPALVAAWRRTFDARPAVQRLVVQWEESGPPAAVARARPDLGLPATPECNETLAFAAAAAAVAPAGSAPWPVRAVRTDAEFAAVADAMVAALVAPGADPGYADFVRWKCRAMRDVVRAGGGTWWAAWDGDVVASAVGVIESAAPEGSAHGGSLVASLQEVVTRPTHRRRGASAHLCHAALADLFARAPRGGAIVVADPDGDAIRVYRRLGFRTIGTSWALVGDRPV